MKKPFEERVFFISSAPIGRAFQDGEAVISNAKHIAFKKVHTSESEVSTIPYSPN